MTARHQRYLRQIQLPEIGLSGQDKLERARVLVVGAGGLGSPALYSLAAAGIGTLGICDGDTVEITNLNRQILHTPGSINQMKTDSAAEQLLRFRPDLELVLIPKRLNPDTVLGSIAGWDIVLDCTDTLEARYMISDACYQSGIPVIEAGISGWEGLVYPILSRNGPCYRCLFPAAPGSMGPQPAIGSVCGAAGAWMAQEAQRFILGIPAAPGHLVRFNGLNGRIQTTTWAVREKCSLCGDFTEKNISSC